MSQKPYESRLKRPMVWRPSIRCSPSKITSPASKDLWCGDLLFDAPDTIRVCDGPACWLKGAAYLSAALAAEFNLRRESGTPAVKIERSSCLGLCDRAPAALIGDEMSGPLDFPHFSQSEPLVFKNRTMIDTNPLLILEGMALAGYATGASVAYIYIRGEHALRESLR
jgi:hypothetical protein